jgi:hypothetical protein
MPQAPEAARQDRQQEAADTCVSGPPQGLGTMALPTVTGGKTHLAVPHVEDPVVRDGHTMGRAADRVSDLLRTCPGWLGVDHPRCGIELSAKQGNAPGAAQGCGSLSDGPGAGGACPGERQRESASLQRAPVEARAPAAMTQCPWQGAPTV